MPNPYNPNPYNEDQDRARQQPLYDQPGGPRQDASQEYHKGDGVFQIPWWVIVITFCFAAWPIGVAMMIINHLLRMGKISAPQSWSQNNRQTGQPYTARPIYADPQKAEKMRRDAQRVVQRAEEAAHKAEKRVEIYQNADRAQAYDPEQTARQNERGRKDKGEGWSIALTVLGVIFSIAMVANLPEAVYWLPEALTQGGSYWTWLFQDLAGSVTLLFAGAGFLFAGWKLRTGRRMRKKISNIVGNAPYMKIQEMPSPAITPSAASTWKTALTRACLERTPTWICAPVPWWYAAHRPLRNLPLRQPQKPSRKKQRRRTIMPRF